MKTVAFAGEYNVITQVAAAYTDNHVNLDVKYRIMANGEQLKILMSRNPADPIPNRYRWTRDAERIFLCVNANDLDFLDHMVEEIKIANFDTTKITLVANADEIHLDLLERFQNFASAYNFSSIFCSIKKNDAYYAMDNTILHQDLKSIFDEANSNQVEAEIHTTAIHIAEYPEPEIEQPRKRDRLKSLFRK